MMVYLVIGVLAALSLLQRLLPWIIMSRYQGGKGLQEIFNLFAVSAFASLAVYNMTEIDPASILSLAVAVVVAVRTKNLGYAVLSAIAVSLAASYI